MLKRKGQTPVAHASEETAKLLHSIAQGAEALRDPEVEARVREYLETNPGYSRDMIHVAAIAISFQTAKVAQVGPASDERGQKCLKLGL
jgi:hypothetical protein